MSKSGTSVSYTYNEDGLRVQKNVSGTVTSYILHGKNVVQLTQGSNNLHFFYGADGSPAVVVYNGASYGYVKNLQGDIVSIVNSSGTEVVHYSYDAWGRLLGKTGTLATSLGTLNPFRYRGYVYDEETGVYYLRSRYYNPSWGRFVNADVKMGTTYFRGHNLFAYTLCNPTNMLDTNGTDAIWIQEGNSAAGFGHSGMMVQDSNDDWYYFFWGPETETLSKEVVFGAELKCAVEKINTHGKDLSNTATVIDVLASMGSDAKTASERANKITATYYFEGNYTKSYEVVCKYQTCGEEYQLLTNNCVQKTLDAFIASDERFKMVEYGYTNALIPNDAAGRVSIMPRKKGEMSWQLWLFYLFFK